VFNGRASGYASFGLRMDWLISIQRWLYGGMADGMRSTTDVASLATLIGAGFVFGMVHAFMPGHGKTVLVSYHLGRPGRPIEGVLTGTLLALTHVGSAIIFVLAGVAVISRSLGAGGRAPAFELASAVMITLIGLFLVGKTLSVAQHQHSRDGKMLAVATGLIPCPLTTFILTYALAKQKLAVGLAAVGGMLAGVIVTLVSFSVAAVLARGSFMSLLSQTERWRAGVGWWLEFAGAVAVLVLGLAMLWPRLR
jgi:nickel/cobalt transporter (NicO) family protein